MLYVVVNIRNSSVTNNSKPFTRFVRRWITVNFKALLNGMSTNLAWSQKYREVRLELAVGGSSWGLVDREWSEIRSETKAIELVGRGEACLTSSLCLYSWSSRRYAWEKLGRGSIIRILVRTWRKSSLTCIRKCVVSYSFLSMRNSLVNEHLQPVQVNDGRGLRSLIPNGLHLGNIISNVWLGWWEIFESSSWREKSYAREGCPKRSSRSRQISKAVL